MRSGPSRDRHGIRLDVSALGVLAKKEAHQAPSNRLETPCLGHLHGDLDKPDEPGGHALTASCHLWSISSRPPESPPRSQPLPGTMCRNVPAALLDSLLGLSSALVSDQDVTPVQAWNFIRCRPQFGALEVRRLNKLAVALRDAVKCHGCVWSPPPTTPRAVIPADIDDRFGAVVNRRFFENLVLQLLLDGQPF